MFHVVHFRKHFSFCFWFLFNWKFWANGTSRSDCQHLNVLFQTPNKTLNFRIEQINSIQTNIHTKCQPHCCGCEMNKIFSYIVNFSYKHWVGDIVHREQSIIYSHWKWECVSILPCIPISLHLHNHFTILHKNPLFFHTSTFHYYGFTLSHFFFCENCRF